MQDPPHAVAVTTSLSWASMIYLARTDAGVVVVDLGWWGAPHALAAGLGQLGARPEDVVAVFLTHSHRDHIAGWPALRNAHFYLAAPEVGLLFGRERHRGFVPRIVESMRRTRLPRPNELTVTGFAGDTMLVFGADTVRAFANYGHTPGSAAYLLRGTLFGGDAVNWRPLLGFRGARPEYSDDVARSRASLMALRERVDTLGVRVICSAHAKCAPADDVIWEKLLRE